MVQGIDLVQIDVVFLLYNVERDVNQPIIKFDSSCVAGMNELRKHKDLKRRQKHEIGLNAYTHYKWYNLVLKLELLYAGTNTKLRIVHWHIEASNKRVFTIRDVLYRTHSIIIGASKEHWYCSNTGTNPANVYGSRYLDKCLYHRNTNRNYSEHNTMSNENLYIVLEMYKNCFETYLNPQSESTLLRSITSSESDEMDERYRQHNLDAINE